MAVLEKMLHILYHEKKERIVLISNYTQVCLDFPIDAARNPPTYLADQLVRKDVS